MLLRDVFSDRFVSLDIVEYEGSGNSQEWFDRNWLVIGGHAKSDDLEWTFRESILTTSEAARLGLWLSEIAQGQAPITSIVPEMYPEEAFQIIEPNLVFGLVAHDEDSATIRVYLQLESSPPDLPTGDFPDKWGYFIELTMRRSAFAEASVAWAEQTARFPPR